MWGLANDTPFAAERAGARDRDGAEIWLVAVKASFDMLDDGTTQLSQDQDPVAMAPAWRGDPAETSLLQDTDLAWGKPATDVLVRGCAHAPEGQAVTQMPVAFAVGPLLRQAVIIGDRQWEDGITGLRETPPVPFMTMPLAWERAYGGTNRLGEPPSWEPRNPVGRGFHGRFGAWPGAPLPNIEDPHARIESVRSRPAPLGFGPISHHWQPRLSFAGTYDQAWMDQRRPLLPRDFDLRFQCAAPPEQQVPGHLRGGEEVQLLHLHPRRARYRTVLPQVDLGLRTRFRGGATEEHRATLSTVTIDTDRQRLIMAWISELPCHHAIQRLLETEVRVVPRARVPARSSPVAAS